MDRQSVIDWIRKNPDEFLPADAERLESLARGIRTENDRAAKEALEATKRAQQAASDAVRMTQILQQLGFEPDAPTLAFEGSYAECRFAGRGDVDTLEWLLHLHTEAEKDGDQPTGETRHQDLDDSQ